MIEIKKATKKYLNKKALDGITLVLPKGKLIGIVGENGAGKSTLLKAIAGLVQLNNGVITVDGSRVDRKISRLISFLSDGDEHFKTYTVFEMMKYYAAQYSDFQMDTAKILATDLKIKLDDKIDALSKGNKSRVKFLLALSRPVPYILMDEPFAGLDPMVRKSITEGILKNIDLKQQTLIITTHDILEVETLLDIVVAVREGRILAVAEVEELRNVKKISIADWMMEIYK